MFPALRLPQGLPLGLALLAAPALGQSTWYVDDDAPGAGTGAPGDPFPSIQAAVDAATTLDGDTLEVAPGTYAPFDFSGKSLRVLGGSDRTIHGAGAEPCVVAASGELVGTRLEGFVLRDGSGRLGAVNTSRGGGVLVDGAVLSIVDCEIVNCDGGPGLSAVGGGVCIAGGADVTLEGTRIAGNTADFGGGIAVDSSALRVEACVLEANAAGALGSGAGGGLHANGGQLDVRDTQFLDNRAFRGAGAYVEGALAEFADSTFRGNTGPLGCLEGGAIAVASVTAIGVGPATVTSCVFEGNYAQFGGALYGSLDVAGSVFRGNGFDQLDANFGGAFHSGPVGSGARAAGSLFENNTAFGQGGACYRVQLFDCVLRGNSALEDGVNFQEALGGALYLGAATDCLFEGNATVDAGIPFLLDAGGGAHSALLLRCVLRDNVSSEGGGAFACSIDRCTLVDNTAAVLGGGAAGGVLVRSSILRGNAPDQVAFLVSGLPQITYCDIEGGAAGAGNFDADPLFFGPVAGDLHLLAGSPCIDAGDPAGVDPDGTRTDVGAFPFDPDHVGSPGTYCVGKVTSAGCTPTISGAGAASLSGPGLECQVASVLGGTVGLVFWSRNPGELSYAGGTLCITGPLVRTAPVAATGSGPCGGVLARTVTGADLAAAGLAPGDHLYLQWFFRDAAQPDGTGLGMSDALEVTVLP